MTKKKKSPLNFNCGIQTTVKQVMTNCHAYKEKGINFK